MQQTQKKSHKQTISSKQLCISIEATTLTRGRSHLIMCWTFRNLSHSLSLSCSHSIDCGLNIMLLGFDAAAAAVAYFQSINYCAWPQLEIIIIGVVVNFDRIYPTNTKTHGNVKWAAEKCREWKKKTIDCNINIIYEKKNQNPTNKNCPNSKTTARFANYTVNGIGFYVKLTSDLAQNSQPMPIFFSLLIFLSCRDKCQCTQFALFFHSVVLE